MGPQFPNESTMAPRHVAIIMDGNGRWAQARGLPRIAGHRSGAEAVRRIVKAAVELGISYLTLFGFSSENWSRPVSEVTDLMSLLRRYLSKEIAELHARQVRLRVIGERQRLSDDINNLISESEKLTRHNEQLTLTLALSYGGRRSIALATRQLAQQVCDGGIGLEDIDEGILQRQLETSDMPDPDLVIRTSGEQRLSNFMLWECAYSEFIFLDMYWPDFTGADLAAAIDEFGRRDRRFGAAG